MTNFLNRMAARAMGAANVAQPLVPARFTPDAALVPGDTPGRAALKTMAGSVEGADPPVTKAVIPGTARDTTLPWDEQGSGLSSKASRDLPAVSPADSLHLLETLDAAEHHDPLMRTTAALPITSNASPHIQPEATILPALDQPAARSLEADVEPLAESEELMVNDAVLVPELAQARPPSATSRLRAALPANSRTVYSRRDQVRGSEPEPPVIRVSIGRIDVRAQFPSATPSPPPARNARPAALSLDEYLKQRSEGKR